jgi:tetratricopeptide (TPR) repeat protein
MNVRRPLGLALAAWLASLAPPAAAAGAPSAADLVARGEEYYVQRQLPRARDYYLAAIRAHPGDFEALCRLVRVECEMGELARGKDDRRYTDYALEHARTVTSLHPDSARGHVWLAVALARQAQREGPFTQVGLAREIKRELDLAIRLDPRSGRAYHARALWYRRIASMSTVERATAAALVGQLPWGSFWEDGLRDLQKAAQLEPHYVKHHLELGRTYLMMKRYGQARGELERALKLSPTSSGRDPGYQAEARDLLRQLPQTG